MKKSWKKRLRTALFLLGGALTGLLWYELVGCPDGTCPITASPLRTVAYMGLIGWLLSMATEGGKRGCNM